MPVFGQRLASARQWIGVIPMGIQLALCVLVEACIGRLMIKIEMKELDDRMILHVEGRLAGAFVPELENSWSAARASQPNRKIFVDLKNVICVDRAGRYLLQLMHSSGVEFLRAGMAIQDILEQVMERKCGP